MSPWRWTTCPKGCDNGDESVSLEERKEVVRVDISYGLNQEKAFVDLSFKCEICGLQVTVGQTKKAKQVIKEISFD